MGTTWIVVADAGHARILSYRDGKIFQAKQIQVFSNGAAQSRDQDLTTDRPGRRSERSTAGGGGRQRPSSLGNYQSTKEHAKEVFAHKLAAFLEHAHNDQSYSTLELIAGPEFLGLLRQELSPEVRKLIQREFDKDLSKEPEHALRQHVAQLHAA